MEFTKEEKLIGKFFDRIITITISIKELHQIISGLFEDWNKAFKDERFATADVIYKNFLKYNKLLDTELVSFRKEQREQELKS